MDVSTKYESVDNLSIKVNDITNCSRPISEMFNKYKAWIIAVVCTALQLIHVGFLFNFGLFFVKLRQEFHTNVATTGLIGSLSYCLFTVCTIQSTWMLRHLSYRKVGLIGISVGSLSLLICSFSPSILYVAITYGVFGMSANISLIATLELAVELFPDRPKRRASAMVLMTLGGTLGNLFLSNLIESTLDALGWRSTLRISAAVLFILGLVCCIFLVVPTRNVSISDIVHQHVSEPKETPHRQRLIRLPETWFFSISSFTCAVAAVFQYVNMASFLVSIGFTDQKSALGITLLALGDATSKIIFVFAAQYISFPITYCLPVSMVASCVLSVTLTLTTNVSAVLTITVLCGLARGIYNGLVLPSGLEIFGADRSKSSASLLMVFCGIGNFVGPFVSGSMYDLYGSYTPALLMCAGLYSLSAITALMTPLWQKQMAPERYMVDDRRLHDAAKHTLKYALCTQTELIEEKIYVV